MNQIILPQIGRRVRTVVVLGHGLNQAPQNLQSLCDALLAEGTIVVQLILTGHGTESVSGLELKKTDWLQVWQTEFQQAVESARKLAQENQVELQFVGFSLSCLLFGLWIQDSPEISFQRAVFFSPILRFDQRMRFLERIGRLPISKLPSFNKKEARRHSWLPFSMYEALFQAIRNLERGRSQRSAIPIRIIIDPRDQMVNYGGLKRWTCEAQWAQWTLQPIWMEFRRGVFSVFHLIVDPEATGPKAWSQLILAMQEFLDLQPKNEI